MGRTSLGGAKSEISSISEQRLKAKNWTEEQNRLNKSPLPVRKAATPKQSITKKPESTTKRPTTPILMNKLKRGRNNSSDDENNNTSDSDNDFNYIRSPKKEKIQSFNETILHMNNNSNSTNNNVINEKKINRDNIAEQRLKASKWKKEELLNSNEKKINRDKERLKASKWKEEELLNSNEKKINRDKERLKASKWKEEELLNSTKVLDVSQVGIEEISHIPISVPASSFISRKETNQDHKNFQSRINDIKQDGPFTLSKSTINEIITKTPIVDISNVSNLRTNANNDEKNNVVLSSQLLRSMEQMEPSEYNEFSEFLDSSGLLGDGESDVDALEYNNYYNNAESALYMNNNIDNSDCKEINQYDHGYIVVLDYIFVIGFIFMSISMFIYGSINILNSLSIIDSTSGFSSINQHQLIEFLIQKSNEFNQNVINPILVFIDVNGVNMIIVTSLLVTCTWICILGIRYLSNKRKLSKVIIEVATYIKTLLSDEFYPLDYIQSDIITTISQALNEDKSLITSETVSTDITKWTCQQLYQYGQSRQWWWQGNDSITFITSLAIENLWPLIKIQVEKDKCISISDRMYDGKAKKCWKLLGYRGGGGGKFLAK